MAQRSNQPRFEASLTDKAIVPEPHGLLDKVIELTGLPPESLRKELNRALAQQRRSPDSLDLESLRQLVAHYVQDVLVELKDDLEKEN